MKFHAKNLQYFYVFVTYYEIHTNLIFHHKLHGISIFYFQYFISSILLPIISGNSFKKELRLPKCIKSKPM